MRLGLAVLGVAGMVACSNGFVYDLPVDDDADGWELPFDCDDANPEAYPFAEELCNGVDDDCDGAVPTAEVLDADGDTFVACEDCADDNPDLNPYTAWYKDADGDGYGDPAAGFEIQCEPLPDYVTNGDDCADDDAEQRPGQTWYLDNDGDGYGNDAAPLERCSRVPGYVTTGGDCDDDNAKRYPGNGC